MSNETDIQTLSALHTIANFAQILPGQGNLPKIQITTPTASAEIYLHGAQITSWIPKSVPAPARDILFLSQHSRFEDGKAIRGGIPICFPWFRDLKGSKSDAPKAPAHGVVRTRAWNLDSISPSGDSAIVTLSLASDEQTRLWFPHDFQITHRITVSAQLKLELIVTNTGHEPFTFEEALHTYHRVASVHSAQILGLDGVHYLDNRDQNREKLQSGPVQLTQATDNAYLHTTGPFELLDPHPDPTRNRNIQLETQNSATTIVWNPWQDGAATLADLGDEEWQQFLCLEASNILESAVTLAPNQTHTLTATLRLSNPA